MLRPCGVCAEPIAFNAYRCPHCGARGALKNLGPGYVKWRHWLFALVFVGVPFGALCLFAYGTTTSVERAPSSDQVCADENAAPLVARAYRCTSWPVDGYCVKHGPGKAMKGCSEHALGIYCCLESK